MADYPPPPCIAASMGVAGNPQCHCHHPMAAMWCLEGHMTECHAGMTCEAAQCSHYERDTHEKDLV